ncbi:hypothetical protein ANN_04072 [Periplaneta americana]|uniref:Uncharacterized protein n=1 Tax=Periplaneta americana TaxID=6978 RepID=A0ABQ8T945_PERAM|nr:hypothetical protein ANN_04072 [Periplaneta americana]
MARLCEGGNEPSGSLKAIFKALNLPLFAPALIDVTSAKKYRSLSSSETIQSALQATSDFQIIAPAACWEAVHTAVIDRSVCHASPVSFVSLYILGTKQTSRTSAKQTEYPRRNQTEILDGATLTPSPMLFGVDGIGDRKMVFGEMRPRIRYRLPGIRLTVEKTSENPQSDRSAKAGIEPTPECNFGSAIN